MRAQSDRANVNWCSEPDGNIQRRSEQFRALGRLPLANNTEWMEARRDIQLPVGT
jgi:hypothetical protein